MAEIFSFFIEQDTFPVIKLEYLAVYGRASMGESWLLDYYRFAFHVLAAFPLTMHNFVVIVEKMPEIYAIESLCSPKKWAKVHQNRLRPATP